MNNPFHFFQNNDTQTEQESQRLRVRLIVLLGLFCALLLTYVGVLFSLQVVHGHEYLENANYTIVRSETVDTVRGEVLDRNGTVLVTNRLSYQVALDLGQMGSDRNQIISDLIDLCRKEFVSWSDSIPISAAAPWTYTRQSPFSYEGTNGEGEPVTYSTLFGSLAKRMKWVSDPAKADLTAQELLTEMCMTFGLIEDESDPITPQLRAVAGVLCELYLRIYEITYADYYLAKDVDIAFITRLKEQSFPGVTVETVTARAYATDTAAHLLGHMGSITPDEWPTYRELGYPMDAYVGKGGIESAFESYLRGAPGTRRIETDADGTVLSESWSVEPAPGNNVVLTLDNVVQATTEQLLAEFVLSLENPAGAAAVMVDMTGGVLAMASYPDFDLSTYYEDYATLSVDPNRPYYNRATMGLYAPGSTFKPLTAIAALSEGVITPRDTVQCTGIYQYYAYANYFPVCWIYTNTGGNHGSETVSEAITDSCNIFFYDVGRRLGIDKLVDYAAQFGLGQYTGIEIGEYKGFVAGPEAHASLGLEWYGGDTLPAAIGQGNHQFTPLQLANYIATLVNGGNHYEAHLLKEIKSSDYSGTVLQYDPVLKGTIEINEQALAAVKKGMYDLSKTATMRQHFGNLPFEVGCKTGTAEVAGAEAANAVFVCFAPYDNPQVALCIVAEQGASGGSLAAVAAGMLAQYFAVSEGQTTVEGENVLIP